MISKLVLVLCGRPGVHKKLRAGCITIFATAIFIGGGCGTFRFKKPQESKFFNPEYVSGNESQSLAQRRFEQPPTVVATIPVQPPQDVANQSTSGGESKSEAVKEEPRPSKRLWIFADSQKNQTPVKVPPGATFEPSVKVPPVELSATNLVPRREERGFFRSLFSRDDKKGDDGTELPRPIEITEPGGELDFKSTERDPSGEQSAAKTEKRGGFFGSLFSRKKVIEPTEKERFNPEEVPTLNVVPGENISRSVVDSVNLRPGLLLDIKVIVTGKNQLEPGAIRISDQGSIFLPMLGSVPANNITLDALRDDLTARYRRYFVNPEVLVDFARDASGEGLSPWGYVTVLGRVKNPGRIMIPATRDLTVSGAIQGAGGFDKSARINAISVTRRNPDGNGQTQRIVNLNAVGSDGKAEEDFVLGADDVVFVPEARF